jgi:hypothetical protein
MEIDFAPIAYFPICGENDYSSFFLGCLADDDGGFNTPYPYEPNPETPPQLEFKDAGTALLSGDDYYKVTSGNLGTCRACPARMSRCSKLGISQRAEIMSLFFGMSQMNDPTGEHCHSDSTKVNLSHRISEFNNNLYDTSDSEELIDSESNTEPKSFFYGKYCYPI